MPKVTLRGRVRADRLRVAAAHLVARPAAALTAPTRIEVRIDRGERHVLTFGDGWAELVLDAPRRVRALELRILAREREGAAVGIGEVELTPGSD